MTDQTRSRDGGNFWMILLIALALIATVIMLFSNSSVWLQVALLAALWAAILGFLLVSRTRRDRDAAEALLDAERREHAAQIEALNARNDAHRASEGLPPSSDAELLREIREELASLRAQLEDLSGREFGYEPAALQAEARRIMEIEARANRATPPQAGQPQPVAQPVPQPAPQPTPQPAPEPAAQPSRPEPAASRRWQAPDAEDDTSRIEPVRDQEQQEHDEAISALQQPQQPEPPQQPQQPEPPRASARQTGPGMPGSSRISGAPSSDAVAGRVGSHRAPEGRNPLTDLIRERQEELDREKAERERRQREEAAQRERAEKQRREEAELRQREEEQRRVEEQRRQEELRRHEEARRAAEARRQQEQREAEERARLEREAREREEQESRGRRRADEHRDGSLTVAELLARSKKGQ